MRAAVAVNPGLCRARLQIQPDQHALLVAHIADECAQRGGEFPNQRRHGDNLILLRQGRLLVDVDHFTKFEESREYDADHFDTIAWKLKEGAYAVFADHVVTPYALQVWK